MDRILLSLGGRLLAVEGDSAVRFLHQYDGARPFIADSGEAEWTVRYDEDLPEKPHGDLLSEFTFSEINSVCHFRYAGDDYFYEMYNQADRKPLVAMHYRKGENSVCASQCDNTSALRFSLWFAVGMLGACSSFTFVHSSVVVHNGRAVLFLGESGTGKSTHTRLWLNNIVDSHLLNDDSPILTIEQGRPYVYGSPWSGKTPCYVARRFPLKAVVRLSQAPQNTMSRLSIPQAFAALHPSLPPVLMQDTHFADSLLDMISDTISAVPSYHLACLPDADAARLSRNTIFDASI
ncbi:MAG: hypothetical protein J6031_04110 [Bacteroidales bacterium]|nr:hypothetical protein [Bacteroidales bacterium]